MSSVGETSAGSVLTETLNGATGDYAVSGDAMRWSPDLAADPERSTVRELPAAAAAAGLGSLLGLDAGGVRRLVTAALYSLTSAASDVVTELRQLARGGSGTGDHPQAAGE